MDDQPTMRNNLEEMVNNIGNVNDLLPYIKHLLNLSDVKTQLLQKIETDDNNDNDLRIRKLYFEVSPNYFFKSLPPQIIIHTIFPFLLTKDHKEFSKMCVLNKLFKHFVSSYHKVHSINKYHIKYFVPILKETKKEIKTVIDIEHKSGNNVFICCPDANEKFECKCIADYHPTVTDELALTEGQKYVVMQTGATGWWYAVDEDGNDGMYTIIVIPNYIMCIFKNAQHVVSYFFLQDGFRIII